MPSTKTSKRTSKKGSPSGVSQRTPSPGAAPKQKPSSGGARTKKKPSLSPSSDTVSDSVSEIPQHQPKPKGSFDLVPNNGVIPGNAIFIGNPSDLTVYLGIANTRFGQIPGAVVDGICRYTRNGRGFKTKDFDYLCSPLGSFYLQPNEGGKAPPPNAIPCQSQGNEVVYPVVCYADGSFIPGKARLDNGRPKSWYSPKEGSSEEKATLNFAWLLMEVDEQNTSYVRVPFQDLSFPQGERSEKYLPVSSPNQTIRFTDEMSELVFGVEEYVPISHYADIGNPREIYSSSLHAIARGITLESGEQSAESTILASIGNVKLSKMMDVNNSEGGIVMLSLKVGDERIAFLRLWLADFNTKSKALLRRALFESLRSGQIVSLFTIGQRIPSSVKKMK